MNSLHELLKYEIGGLDMSWY